LGPHQGKGSTRMTRFGHKIKKIGLGLIGLLILNACAGAPPKMDPPVVITPPVITPPTDPNPNPTLPNPGELDADASLSNLAGFSEASIEQMVDALSATCRYKSGTQYSEICKQWAHFQSSSNKSLIEKRDFILSHFEAKPIDGTGLMTGYYVPEYDARLVKSDEFSQVIRPRPNDLVIVSGSEMTPPVQAQKIAARKVGSEFVLYFDRADIELMPDTGGLYMRPEDYFLCSFKVQVL